MKTDTSFLDSIEFFDLMQAYRIADPANQDTVVRRFEAVKDYIKKQINPKALHFRWTAIFMYNGERLAIQVVAADILEAKEKAILLLAEQKYDPALVEIISVGSIGIA